MKPSGISLLRQPWRFYAMPSDAAMHHIPRQRRRREKLTTKMGNKNFYKGTGAAGMGSHTRRGGYIVDWDKVRTYVTPEGLDETPLRPYVHISVPELRNSFKNLKLGAVDGQLYLEHLRDYIEYGPREPLSKRRDAQWIQRA